MAGNVVHQGDVPCSPRMQQTLRDRCGMANGYEAARPFDLIGMRTGIKHAHLETALALQIHGSLTKAAEALGTKPGNISRRLRDLEFLLGTQVFDRQSKGKLVPTRAGTIFLRQSRELLTEFRRLVEAVREVGDGKAGKIAVGYYGALAHGALHDFLFKPDPIFRTIRLRPVELAHDAIGTALANGYVDVAFVWGMVARPVGDVITRPLWNERILVVLPEHHRLASYTSLTWQDLADELFLLSSCDPKGAIGQFLAENLAPLHREPRQIVEDVGPTNIIHMIAAERGIGLSLETMLCRNPSGTVYREISSDAGPEYVTAFACWREDNANPVFEAFLKRLLIRFPTVTGVLR